jgi:DNA-directed RNA polymerase subunit RPC12/RpoP
MNEKEIRKKLPAVDDEISFELIGVRDINKRREILASLRDVEEDDKNIDTLDIEEVETGEGGRYAEDGDGYDDIRCPYCGHILDHVDVIRTCTDTGYLFLDEDGDYTIENVDRDCSEEEYSCPYCGHYLSINDLTEAGYRL